MIKKDIVFSHNKDLYLEYPPYFKIYKCPDDFPHPPYEMGHHPYFIEYKTEKAYPKKGLGSGVRQIKEDNKYTDYKQTDLPDSFLQNENDFHIKNEYILLINALTGYYFFDYGRQLRHGWTIDVSNNCKLSHSQEGYMPPDYEKVVNEMTFTGSYKVSDLLLQISEANGDIVREIGLRDLITIYHEIKDIQCKKDFLNACIVFNKAQYLASYEISASYLFMVSALEALIEMEQGDMKIKTCDLCNQKKYKVIQKFKDFIDKYGYKIDNKIKNYFYELRSKIAHFGKLLGSSYDSNFFIQSQEDLDDEYLTTVQRRTYEDFKHLTQVCFSKYLLSLEKSA